MADNMGNCWIFFHQSTHVIAQGFPLRLGEFVSADQADADTFAVVSLRMRAHFVQVAAGGDCAIVVNDEVVTDRKQAWIEFIAEFIGAFKTARLVPLVNVKNIVPATVGRSCTMNDDVGDLSSVHAAMMADEAGKIKAEMVPPEGAG